MLAGDDASRGRRTSRGHRRRVFVHGDEQVGVVVRVEHHHRLAVGHRLQGRVHDRLQRRIEIARWMQDRDGLAGRLVVRRLIDWPQEPGCFLVLDRLEEHRRLLLGQGARTLFRGRPFLGRGRVGRGRPLLFGGSGRRRGRVPVLGRLRGRRPGRRILFLPGLGFAPLRGEVLGRGSRHGREPGVVRLGGPGRLGGRFRRGRRHRPAFLARIADACGHRQPVGAGRSRQALRPVARERIRLGGGGWRV